MKIKFQFFAVIIIFLLAGVSPMAAVETNGAVHTGVFPFYEYAAKYDVWNYIPMDQGGRLIQLKVIGSDRDADVIKAIRSPGFFAPWGDPIRWDALEKTDPEKSYWLNRWYFLPCFARQYYLTGEKEFLNDMLAFIRKWAAENPEIRRLLPRPCRSFPGGRGQRGPHPGHSRQSRGAAGDRRVDPIAAI